jgi:glycolate oxidase
MNPINNNTISKLKRVLGEGKVKYSPEDLKAYSYDGYLTESMPDVVLFPESSADVVNIVKLADEEGFFVTPRGSGSNLCGGSIAKQGGAVLSFTKMNKIIEISPESRFVRVEPGVIIDELQEELASKGLFYPVDLGSSRIATIGGSIALNSGGMRAVKYGVTRDYILSLKAVLSGGTEILTGALSNKDVAGYDLKSLICGSEGTLAVITEAALRVRVKPEYRSVILAHFKSLGGACTAINSILSKGIVPSALEFMDNLTINTVEDYMKIGPFLSLIRD